MHSTNLAKKYAEEQRQIREQQQKQHLQRLQREKEIERERDRERQQLERQKGQQKDIEEIEISSSSSSSSSSSDDDDSDVQLVLPPSKPIAAVGPAPSFKSSKEADKIKGVSWLKDKGKWRARLVVSGKNRHIGCFGTSKAAAAAIQVVQKALDESGFPFLSEGDCLKVFDSAKAKAKEAAKAADASGTYSLCFGDHFSLFVLQHELRSHDMYQLKLHFTNIHLFISALNQLQLTHRTQQRRHPHRLQPAEIAPPFRFLDTLRGEVGI